jgi:uncharacterized phage protein (TIGR02220 family)
VADQGTWFKLWISALSDPDLANLSLEYFARWCILGTYIKAHGTAGRLRLTAPARALSGLLQVGDFVALQEVFHRLPNVITEKGNQTVSPETILTVTLRNWSKYQGDYSTARVRKFREMKRSKRRGEESRREETRSIPPISPPNGGSPWPVARAILDFLNHKTGRHYQPTRTNLLLIVARLKDGATEAQCRAVIGRKTAEWKTDVKMSGFLRPATLFNATKFNQYQGELPATAFEESHD